jgi:isochorismate pyruvate lyase
MMTNYLSDTRNHTAEECNAMSEVRYEIDRLDRLLVTLIKERQDYMDAAERIKDSRSVVRDEARVEDVVRKVLDAAIKAGLSAKIAEPVWRTMIEQCIAYEFEAWDELRKD